MSRTIPFALVALTLTALVGTVHPLSASANAPAKAANMKTRFDVLFRLGFAGSIKADFGGVTTSSDADTSPGAELRVDVPVGRHVTLGPSLSVYAARADVPGQDRNPLVDISGFMKGRYPFKAGEKKAELYGLVQVGFTMAFLRQSTGADDRFGPGWNIGIAPGVQILIAKHFGLLTEFGWLRSQGKFDLSKLILNQAVWRVGFVF